MPQGVVQSGTPAEGPGRVKYRRGYRGRVIDLEGRVDEVSRALGRLSYHANSHATLGGHPVFFNATLEAENARTAGQFDRLGTFGVQRTVPPDARALAEFDGLLVLPRILYRKYPGSTTRMYEGAGKRILTDAQQADALETERLEQRQNNTILIKQPGRLYTLFDLGLKIALPEKEGTLLGEKLDHSQYWFSIHMSAEIGRLQLSRNKFNLAGIREVRNDTTGIYLQARLDVIDLVVDAVEFRVRRREIGQI